MPRAFTRIDVTRDTKINTESRLFLSTDYPGSPNLPVDIAKLPIYTSYGNTLGLTQRFNHLELIGQGERTTGPSTRTPSSPTAARRATTTATTPNTAARCARATRCSRACKPFVEVGGDTRKHDLQFDRDGYQRDSQGVHAAGSAPPSRSPASSPARFRSAI